MIGSIGADGCLDVGNGDIGTSQILVSQGFKGQRESLAVQIVVAVGGAAIVLGCEGLLDGALVVLHVHLHELEDGLALLGRRGVVSADGHGGCASGVGDAVAGYIRDTIDGACGLTAWADLFDLCHNYLIIEN